MFLVRKKLKKIKSDSFKSKNINKRYIIYTASIYISDKKGTLLQKNKTKKKYKS